MAPSGAASLGVAMKTLYLTKHADPTDLSSYQTAAQTAALLPYENFFINGGFEHWQRSTSLTSISSNTETWAADRFYCLEFTDAVCDINKRTLSPTAGYPFLNYIEMSCTTADAAVDASHFSWIGYKVEGRDIVSWEMGASGNTKSFTIGFWHKHTVTGTYCVAVENNALNRSYVTEYTQSVADTWEYATVTIPCDTSGTWLTAAGVIGAYIYFTASCGANGQQTADTWAAADAQGTSNQANAWDTIGNKFCLANVQGTLTDSIVPWNPRPYAQERALCQRYAESSYDDGTALGTVTNNGMSWHYITDLGTSAVHIIGKDIRFKVSKAASPTLTFYSPATGTSGKARDFLGTADVTPTGSTGLEACRWNASGNGAAVNINMGLHYFADAEL